MLDGTIPFPPHHPSHDYMHMQRAGGIFQKTLKDGKVFVGRKVDEIMVAYDDEFSSQPEDVYIIDYIAYRLGGNEPKDAISIGILDPNDDGNPEWHWLPTPIPYLIINNDEKLVLAPDRLQLLFEGTDWQDTELGQHNNLNNSSDPLAAFEAELQIHGFKAFTKDDYKLWDNTSQYLPVGLKRRPTSRKILEDLVDTEIVELLPGDLNEQIDRLFALWNNIKDKMPVGWKETSNINLISNGDFGGGIGPGDYIGQSDDTIIGTVVKENPGFSPYVLRTSNNSTDLYYNIEIPLADWQAGNDLVLSGWVAKGPGYPQQYTPHFFGRRWEWMYSNEEVVTTVQEQGNNLYGTIVDDWTENAEEQEWRRWKKGISIPTAPASSDPNATIISCKLIWKLGKVTDDLLNDESTSFRYFTGLRVEYGDNLNDSNYIQLTNPSQKTILKLARDIQDLVSPGNVPIFSTNNVENLVDAQKISGILEELFLEIKETLSNLLEEFTSQSAGTINQLSSTFGKAIEQATDEDQTLSSLDQNFSVTLQNFLNSIVTYNNWNWENNPDVGIPTEQEMLDNNITIESGFVHQITELKAKIDNIENWITALNAVEQQPYIDVNPEDTYDDASYNAGYTAGETAGYDAAYAEYAGIEVAQSQYDMNLELFDLNNDGIINFEEIQMLQDTSIDHIWLTSTDLQNPYRTDQQFYISFYNPWETDEDDGGIFNTEDYIVQYQYNRQILIDIIQRIISGDANKHPYSFENNNEVVDTKDVFALLSLRPWMMADGYEGGMRCHYEYGTFKNYGLVPVVLDMMKVMTRRAIEKGWSQQHQLISPYTSKTVGTRMTDDITMMLQNFDNVAIRNWHNYAPFEDGSNSWLWGGVVEDSSDHSSQDGSDGQGPESMMFSDDDIMHTWAKHARITGTNGQPTEWNLYAELDPVNTFMENLYGWPGLEAALDTTPPYDAINWTWPYHPNVEYDGDGGHHGEIWERRWHPYTFAQPFTVEGSDPLDDAHHEYDDIRTGWVPPNTSGFITNYPSYDDNYGHIYICFKDILSAMYLYHPNVYYRTDILARGGPGSSENVCGHMEWHDGRGLPQLVIEEMILQYTKDHLLWTQYPTWDAKFPFPDDDDDDTGHGDGERHWEKSNAENQWGPGCFRAGTKINTPDGYKVIEEIKVGDIVKSYDIYKKEVVNRKVIKTFVHLDDTDGLILNNKINTTQEHRFYTSENKWVHAKDLNIGDKILNIDGSYKSIESIELDSEAYTVYNFRVIGTENYFVEDILAHNRKNENGNIGQY